MDVERWTESGPRGLKKATFEKGGGAAVRDRKPGLARGLERKESEKGGDGGARARAIVERCAAVPVRRSHFGIRPERAGLQVNLKQAPGEN